MVHVPDDFLDRAGVVGTVEGKDMKLVAQSIHSATVGWTLLPAMGFAEKIVKSTVLFFPLDPTEVEPFRLDVPTECIV